MYMLNYTMPTEDLKWIHENHSVLRQKYPNMYIAVKNGEVIAADKEFGKVYEQAKKKTKEFVTDYILSGELIALSII